MLSREKTIQCGTAKVVLRYFNDGNVFYRCWGIEQILIYYPDADTKEDTLWEAFVSVVSFVGKKCYHKWMENYTGKMKKVPQWVWEQEIIKSMGKTVYHALSETINGEEEE